MPPQQGHRHGLGLGAGLVLDTGHLGGTLAHRWALTALLLLEPLSQTRVPAVGVVTVPLAVTRLVVTPA